MHCLFEDRCIQQNMLNHPTRNPYEATSRFSGTDWNPSSGLVEFLMLSLLITTSGRAPLDPLGI